MTPVSQPFPLVPIQTTSRVSIDSPNHTRTRSNSVSHSKPLISHSNARSPSTAARLPDEHDEALSPLLSESPTSPYSPQHGHLSLFDTSSHWRRYGPGRGRTRKRLIELTKKLVRHPFFPARPITIVSRVTCLFEIARPESPILRRSQHLLSSSYS
jgi:hypothetical protein